MIDQKSIYLHKNTKEHKLVEVGNGDYRLEYKPRSLYQRVTDFVETAFGGPFRLGQLGDRIFKLIHMVRPNEGLKNVSTVFNKGWTVTIIPRLFGASKDAKNAIVDATKPSTDADAARRKYMKVVHDVADAGAAWGYSSSLILGCFQKTANASLSVLKAADAITFVGDVTDLEMHAEDFSKARALAAKAEQINARDEVKATIKDTEKFHLLKTLKAVCSVAGFILGFAIALSGAGAVLGLAIAAASISLGATVFAIGASLHEEGMKHERIKFFDEKHVQRLPTAVAV